MAIIESSIDCSIHYNNLPKDIQKTIKCKVCAPTNQPLYNIDLYKDLKEPNTCQEPKEKKIKVKEIKVNDESFYYSFEDNKLSPIIYTFDESSNAYIPLKKSYPLYSDIVRKILF